MLVKLSVSLASSAILKTDWATLIDQAEKFIEGLKAESEEGMNEADN